MSLSTTVGAVICAAHQNEDGQIHGHTWTVWATFPSGVDAIQLQNSLRIVLRRFDHVVLPHAVSTGEQLAAEVGRLLNDAISVRVERLPELIIAEWKR